MAVKGVFASDNGAIGNRVGDFSHVVKKIMPTGNAPLLALSTGMKRERATDVIVNWMEQNYFMGRIKVIQEPESCCGQIILEDTSTVVQGQVYMVECTGEYLYVLGVNCNAVQVLRGHGKSPVASIPAGTHIQKIGTGFEEGSDAPNAYKQLPFPRFNFTQIFRNSWGLTRTAQRVKTHTAQGYAENKREALMMHAEEIEWSSLWGIQEMGVQNGMPLRFADGFNNQILTNRFVQPSTGFSIDMLDGFIQLIFSKNVRGAPNERIAFVGNAVIAVINKLVREMATYNITAGEASFGMKVNKWMTPFGDLTFVTHPLMNSNPTFAGDMYVYHPACMRYKWLDETVVDDYNRHGTRGGRDADKGVVTSELTFIYSAEITGGIFSGICKPDLRKECPPCKEDPCCNTCGAEASEGGCGCGC